MLAPALGLVMVVQIVALLLGFGLIATCSESDKAGADQVTACDWATDSTLNWFLLVLWPSAFFGASLLLPWSREHSLALAVATAILAGAFWIFMFVTA